MMQHRGLLALVVVLAGAPPVTASANVITDWDEIGVKTVQPIGAPPPINPGLFFRAMAMMHIAMFNAVNAIEPRYQSYKFQNKAEPGASQEAAAASAAANGRRSCQRRRASKADELSCDYSRQRCEGSWRQARRGGRLEDAGVARRRRIEDAERLSARDPARCLRPNQRDYRLGVHHDDTVRDDQPVAISSWTAG